MFSSAFKSFVSNINSNYDLSKQPVASAGVWQVFDAKKRSVGTLASVFVFDRRSLDVQSSGLGARASSTSVRKAQDEVFDRLKQEASSLARLRHPSILQLVEPVEDTRSGGLMFATERIISSLSGALLDKADHERTSGASGRSPRYAKEADEAAETPDLELDELEIQKGLLQVAKGLEFLHDSAKLVHGNLTPDAIFINAKSDWKISGLAFAGPPDGAEGHQSSPQISLSEVLHNDPRIPRTVQLNLDYTSPDFVLDHNVNSSADIFSLGLVVLALYNNPPRSPVETHGNQSTYKKIFSSNVTTPLPANNFLCSRPLPRELIQTLPRILARRPAQRMTATEFQQSDFFDNILVNTIRFLDTLPAKSANEKAQFMRGLGRVMPQFPASVLGKKVLIALLDELKDRELLALILQNVFKIVETIPAARRVFPEKILPRLREVFLTKSKTDERDSGREAGLLVVLENIQLISKSCTAKEFKDDVLPIIHIGMESPTHSLVDASMQTIAPILPVLDFSTVKHDLFPVVATVFSKTSSLSIKVRGLEALGILCGASSILPARSDDDLSGITKPEAPSKSVSSLDKFTMQEKVVPLLKGIKTKEPAVAMAALKVFEQIGNVADTDFLAIEVMPILWSFALGPLLSLVQFKAYIELIKTLSAKIEREQVRKLQDLSSTNRSSDSKFVASFPALSNGTDSTMGASGNEADFEKLVIGSRTTKPDVFSGALSAGQKLTPNPPTFSWSSPGTAETIPKNTPSMVALRPQAASRSITPDVTISSFPTLQPVSASSASTWGTPAQSSGNTWQLQPQPSTKPSILPSSVPAQTSNIWQTQPPSAQFSTHSPALAPPHTNRSTSQTNIWQPQPSQPSGFAPTLAPPPTSRANSQTNTWPQPVQPSAFGAPTPPIFPQSQTQPTIQPQTQQKSGLDKYQSLL